jgi:RHS repeat-associated protein
MASLNCYKFTSHAWDFENRLTSVTLPGSGGTVTFKYDPFARRIYKSSSSGTSIFAYDGDNLVEKTNSSGTAVARYEDTQNIDEPLAMLRGGATSFYHADGLGSVTSLSNTAGSLAQTYQFDSFGKQTAASGSLTNPFQYTAREFDSETSLYYYRARYYDPTNGRFISEDPIRLEGAANFYAFVSNDPIDHDDPSGLKCTTKIMLVTAYCTKGRTASGSRAGPGTVATANTNAPSRPNPKPIPYPFGCSVTVDNAAGGDPWPTEYEGTIQDTGAGWDSWWKNSKHHHHDVLPDAWIDIWMFSCKKARQYGPKYRTVTICCDDCNQ